MFTIISHWDMPIKHTMRYHNTLIRMAEIKYPDNINASNDVEKMNHSYISGGNVK